MGRMSEASRDEKFNTAHRKRCALKSELFNIDKLFKICVKLDPYSGARKNYSTKQQEAT